MKKMNAKKLIGAGTKIVAACVVLAFLGLKSLDFFFFTTPADQWYYAYLGFGLTGGGVIAYLIIFLWDADTPLRKTIAIVMLGVCVIGELATAGFGLRIDAWQKGGYQLAEADFNSMVMAVQLLGFAHAIALIGYVAGDRLAEAFGDEDHDGIPNYRDKDYKKGKLAPAYAKDTPKVQQQEYRAYNLNDFLREIGMSKDEVRAAMKARKLIGESETRDALKQMGRWPSDLSNNNFKKLFGELNGQNADPTRAAR